MENKKNKVRGFRCSKCSNLEYEEGAVHMTGGFLGKMFDVQNKKFVSISCTKCGFTEFYKKILLLEEML